MKSMFDNWHLFGLFLDWILRKSHRALESQATKFLLVTWNCCGDPRIFFWTNFLGQKANLISSLQMASYAARCGSRLFGDALGCSATLWILVFTLKMGTHETRQPQVMRKLWWWACKTCQMARPSQLCLNGPPSPFLSDCDYQPSSGSILSPEMSCAN